MVMMRLKPVFWSSLNRIQRTENNNEMFFPNSLIKLEEISLG